MPHPPTKKSSWTARQREETLPEHSRGNRQESCTVSIPLRKIPFPPTKKSSWTARQKEQSLPEYSRGNCKESFMVSIALRKVPHPPTKKSSWTAHQREKPLPEYSRENRQESCMVSIPLRKIPFPPTRKSSWTATKRKQSLPEFGEACAPSSKRRIAHGFLQPEIDRSMPSTSREGFPQRKRRKIGGRPPHEFSAPLAHGGEEEVAHDLGVTPEEYPLSSMSGLTADPPKLFTFGLFTYDTLLK
ncbi:uncharacterized protein [Dermacentor albipictus]|uniref:uncharacterized protein n=1 Tax=Dermacentor albipictus TaxID=60249 RepID=UPI0038FCBDCF